MLLLTNMLLLLLLLLVLLWCSLSKTANSLFLFLFLGSLRLADASCCSIWFDGLIWLGIDGPFVWWSAIVIIVCVFRVAKVFRVVLSRQSFRAIISLLKSVALRHFTFYYRPISSVKKSIGKGELENARRLTCVKLYEFKFFSFVKLTNIESTSGELNCRGDWDLRRWTKAKSSKSPSSNPNWKFIHLLFRNHAYGAHTSVMK